MTETTLLHDLAIVMIAAGMAALMFDLRRLRTVGRTGIACFCWATPSRSMRGVGSSAHDHARPGLN